MHENGIFDLVEVSFMRPQPKPGGAVKYNPARHHRHSIRLKGYDYSSAGAYFITAVLHHRMHLFGRVCENGMQLSEAGKIAHRCWEEIPLHFPHTALDEFIIMPDHMHGIVVIVEEENGGYEDCSGGGSAQLNAPTRLSISASPIVNISSSTRKDNYFSIISPKKKTLSVIIRTYKAAVTTICRENGIHEFQWQRNYYEHIIRNEREFMAIRKYILNNPAQWLHERENQHAM